MITERKIPVFLLIYFLFLALCPGCAFAQSVSPDLSLRGIVWDIPNTLDQAEIDLQYMHKIGVAAVRTGLIVNESLLTHADTLGIRIYQELPLAHLPAAHLQDSLNSARAMLQQALARSYDHPSARDFGLAQLCDMSDPEAIPYIQSLTRQIRETGAPETRSYYVTSFIEDDCCNEFVDFVLLDVRNVHQPIDFPRRWQNIHRKPVGLAAMGTWNKLDAEGGFRVPHTPAYQARYLEEHLSSTLFNRELIVVFVERWRDVTRPRLSTREDIHEPYARRYGLFTMDGLPRPAFDVVVGFFTDQQNVFAFEAGTPTNVSRSWLLILMSWFIVAVLALLNYFSMWFPQILHRYFLAHGFYLETIRQGRDLSPGSHMVLLVLMGCAAGLVIMAALWTAQQTVIFPYIFDIGPTSLQSLLLFLLNNPWSLLLIVVGLYILFVTLLSLILMLFGYGRLRFQQVLLLVLWPRWPIFLLLVASVVIYMLDITEAVYGMYGLGLGWILMGILGLTRTLLDLAHISRRSVFMTGLIGWSIPLGCIGLCFLLIWYQGEVPTLTFFWHLVTRN